MTKEYRSALKLKKNLKVTKIIEHLPATIYFSIITITKIGFGDLVPSMLPPEKYARYYLLI